MSRSAAGGDRSEISSSVRGPWLSDIDVPSEIVVVDLGESIPDLESNRFGSAVVVVRDRGSMLGTVTTGTPISGVQLAALIKRELATPIARQSGGDAARSDLFGRSEKLRADGPAVSVILCTRNRPELARRCVLSLLAVDYANLEIVVVDNAPSDDQTRQAVSDLGVVYVREDLPGLSRARNRGVQEAHHALIAFIDDDETADPLWVAALVDEFESDPGVGAVTGLVLPLHVDTPEAVSFEKFGGHSKGRGAQRWVFDRAFGRNQQSPYFPRPTFGAGANMSFRREVIERFGYFDAALGAGTPTFGAEDTLALSETMLLGSTVVYTPHAVTWHEHRESAEQLDSQLAGYGIGIGAFYAALVARSPRRLPHLVLALLRAVWRSRSVETASAADDAQTGLRLMDMVRGPWIYLRTRRQRR